MFVFSFSFSTTVFVVLQSVGVLGFDQSFRNYWCKKTSFAEVVEGLPSDYLGEGQSLFPLFVCFLFFFLLFLFFFLGWFQSGSVNVLLAQPGVRSL